jgi:hypothetical protein
VAEYEDERGELPEESRQRAREFLMEAGLSEWRSPDFLALHDELTRARIRPVVPAVVLAQAWRGGPQHQISRVLMGCDIIPDDEPTARAGGIACGASGTADAVDAIVVATAVQTKRPSSPATPMT